MKHIYLILSILFLFILASCQDDAPVPVPTLQTEATVPEIVVATLTPTQPAGPTAVPPTETPTAPVAALVNGTPIFLATYEQELARYEQGILNMGLSLEDDAYDYKQEVLNRLIEMNLIKQTAAQENLTITQAELDTRLNELRNSSGSATNFTAWLAANQWSEEEFPQILADQMLMAKLVDQMMASIPNTLPHVRARYLQVDNLPLAEQIYAELNQGADFATLAQTHSLDRTTGPAGGDLGFFSTGTLLLPEVETAAFALNPGEFSPIIAITPAETGQTIYLLVQTVELDPTRMINDATRGELGRIQFEQWLADRWAESEILQFLDQN